MIIRPLVIALALLGTLVSISSATEIPFYFSPDGCELSVEFPDQPKISIISVPGFGDYEEADLSNPRMGIMRANCISVSGDEPIRFFNNRDLTLTQMRSFMEQNGMQNVSYAYEEVPLGFHGVARGGKQLRGQWITYVGEWFITRHSVMSLVVGYLATGYPTPEISGFLLSISEERR